MMSACIARLISTFSLLKIQAIMNSQIDAKNCLEWGNKLSDKRFFKDIKSVHPLHERLTTTPDFMVSELQYNSIKFLAIEFSSILEYFLKDSIRLNLMRNYSLLEKALMETNQVIDPKDIVEVNDIEQIRYKYIINISEHLCSGELWKNKFKKYLKLLGLSKDLSYDPINNKIDAIWEMRNDISHANTKTLSLNYDGRTYQFDSNISADDYTDFAILLIELVDKVIPFLSKVDTLSLEKWKATDATLLYK